MERLAIELIAGYKRWVSPALPVSCRFVPTCSEYAMEAFERYGLWRGAAMTLWRIARCRPLGSSGYDPVPVQAELDATEALAAGRDEPCTHWQTAAVCQCGNRGPQKAPRLRFPGWLAHLQMANATTASVGNRTAVPFPTELCRGAHTPGRE